jgi:hypothetical protein
MKTRNIATAIALTFAFAGGAYAAQPVYEPDNTPFQGVYGQDEANAPTRAQVVAQLQQAKAAGVATFGEADDTPFAPVADDGVTRTQVAQEVRDAGGPAIAFGDPDNEPFQGSRG